VMMAHCSTLELDNRWPLPSCVRGVNTFVTTGFQFFREDSAIALNFLTVKIALFLKLQQNKDVLFVPSLWQV
jgi:hypothetical protein